MTRENFLIQADCTPISTQLGNVPTIIKTIQLSIPTSQLDDHVYLQWLIFNEDSELVKMAKMAGIDLDKEFNLAMGYYGNDFIQHNTTIQITQTLQKHGKEIN